MGLRNKPTEALTSFSFNKLHTITEMEDAHFDASEAFKVRLRNRPRKWH